MTTRVLILCTGNSARSQMAEGLLRAMGGGAIDVFSAGTKPGIVRPEAIAIMAERGIDISGHRSKHVDEFSGQTFDYVITVCDNANETCPVFPGTPRRVHWGLPDPAAVDGAEDVRLEAFRRVCAMLDERFSGFLSEHSDLTQATRLSGRTRQRAVGITPRPFQFRTSCRLLSLGPRHL